MLTPNVELVEAYPPKVNISPGAIKMLKGVRSIIDPPLSGLDMLKIYVPPVDVVAATSKLATEFPDVIVTPLLAVVPLMVVKAGTPPTVAPILRRRTQLAAAFDAEVDINEREFRRIRLRFVTPLNEVQFLILIIFVSAVTVAFALSAAHFGFPM
jgi:hypothetical protein